MQRHPATAQTQKIRNAGPFGAGQMGFMGSDPLGMISGIEQSTAQETRPGLDVSGSVSLTRRIEAISRWRDFYDPLAAFDVARARALSQDYTRGWMADLQWTYFFLEGIDPDLFALVDRRTSRLLEMDYTISVKADKSGTSEEKQGECDDGENEPTENECLAEEQASCLRDKFEKIDNLYEAIEHLAMASFRGYAHCEKWYGTDGDLNHFELVDQWNMVRDGLRGGWRYNPRAMQAGYYGLSAEMTIDPKNFLFREVRRHINRIALLKFCSKKLSEVDWDAYGEIYGIPSGVVIGPPNVPAEKVNEFSAAAEQISQGGSGFLPYGSIYEKNDMPNGGTPFKERLEYLTEKLILVGTGGLLTMLSRSGSGTLAGNAHADVFEQLAKAEAMKISEAINRQVSAPILDQYFPGKPKLAYFKLASQEETSVKDIIEHIASLASAGYRVDPEEVTERTGYTVTLAPPAAAPADMQPNPLNDAADEEGEDENDPENPEGQAPKPEDISNRRIRNEGERVDAAKSVFDRNAIRKLTAAQTEAVQPVLDRIATLKELTDAEFAAALEAFRKDLPRLFAEARLHSPDIASIWEQVLGTALVDGLAHKPSSP